MSTTLSRQIEDYFTNTRNTFDRYNQIIDKIKTSPTETSDEEDEFLTTFQIMLAHSLSKDFGTGSYREELKKVAAILEAAL